MAKCEAKYGDKKCDKDAKYVVVANGSIFNLCADCAKLVRRQNKLNNPRLN